MSVKWSVCHCCQWFDSWTSQFLQNQHRLHRLWTVPQQTANYQAAVMKTQLKLDRTRHKFPQTFSEEWKWTTVAPPPPPPPQQTSLQPGLSTSWCVLACSGCPAFTGFRTTLSPMTTCVQKHRYEWFNNSVRKTTVGRETWTITETTVVHYRYITVRAVQRSAVRPWTSSPSVIHHLSWTTEPYYIIPLPSAGLGAEPPAPTLSVRSLTDSSGLRLRLILSSDSSLLLPPPREEDPALTRALMS